MSHPGVYKFTENYYYDIKRIVYISTLYIKYKSTYINPLYIASHIPVSAKNNKRKQP